MNGCNIATIYNMYERGRRQEYEQLVYVGNETSIMRIWSIVGYVTYPEDGEKTHVDICNR